MLSQLGQCLCLRFMLYVVVLLFIVSLVVMINPVDFLQIDYYALSGTLHLAY